MTITYIILAVAVVLVGWVVFTFNALVLGRNRVKEGWADIDVQLKRRYDLIPNLVETVKGYATHERELLENVTRARTSAMQATSVAEHSQADNALADTLKSLFAVAENYPNLKANENFGKLQDELSDTENKIQAARRFYNSTVLDFNTKIEQFPSNLLAGMFNFMKSDFYELSDADSAAKEPVKVQF